MIPCYNKLKMYRQGGAEMASNTKEALGNALKQMLAVKPIEKITVKDLVDICCVNRQTFYYHFHDIVELTEWICEEEGESALKKNTTYATWQEGFLGIFEILRQDKVFVTNICRHTSPEYLNKYLYKVTYQLLYNVVCEQAEGLHVREEEKVFIADFYKYGFVGIIMKWVNSDMEEDPRIIVERLNRLIEGTIRNALSRATNKKI